MYIHLDDFHLIESKALRKTVEKRGKSVFEKCESLLLPGCSTKSSLRNLGLQRSGRLVGTFLPDCHANPTSCCRVITKEERPKEQRLFQCERKRLHRKPKEKKRMSLFMK